MTAVDGAYVGSAAFGFVPFELFDPGFVCSDLTVGVADFRRGMHIVDRARRCLESLDEPPAFGLRRV